MVSPETNIYGLTEAERISIIVVKMIMGTLSVFASSLLIYNASKQLKLKQAGTYHRLLIGMSVMDVMYSIFGGSLIVWMVPPDSGAWGATVGNTQSCIVSGFFSQMSIGAPLYNASLAIFFMITLLLGRRATQQVTLRMEPFLHVLPWSIALVTSTYGLHRDWYNAADVPELGCWIEQYPLNCKYNDDVACTRGPTTPDEVLRIKWAVMLYPLWAIFGVVLLCNAVILYVVYIQELRNRRYTTTGGSRRPSKTVRATAVQSFLYVMVMALTIMGSILAEATVSFSNVSLEAALYPFHLLFVLTHPSQGIFNFLVYIRRRLVRHRNEKKISYFKAFLQVSFPDSAQLDRLSSFWRRSSRAMDNNEDTDNLENNDDPFAEASSSLRRSASMNDGSVRSSSSPPVRGSMRRLSTVSIPEGEVSSASKGRRTGGGVAQGRTFSHGELFSEDTGGVDGGKADCPLQRSIRFAKPDVAGLVTSNDDIGEDMDETGDAVVPPADDSSKESLKQQTTTKMAGDDESLDKLLDVVEQGKGDIIS